MVQNLLIHCLRYSDLLFADSKGHYKDNMFSRVFWRIKSLHPELTFNNIILYLPFNKLIVENVREIEYRKILDKANSNLEYFQSPIKNLNEYKDDIKKFFTDEFKCNVEIYGPTEQENKYIKRLIEDICKLTKELDINKYIIYGNEDDFQDLINNNLTLKSLNIIRKTDKYSNLGSKKITSEREYISRSVFAIYNSNFHNFSEFTDYPSKDLFYANTELNRQIKLAQIKPVISNVSEVFDNLPKDIGNIITVNKEMKDLIRKAIFYSKSNWNVLITGESGTGKELFTKAIFDNREIREKKLISFNSASFSKDLFESELFGYVKGAFTGATESKKGFLEIADGATLFIDEIGELEYATQSKLLRAVECKEFYKVGSTILTKSNFRLICATNKTVKTDPTFREDLYSRIAQLTIEIPPLRSRGQDDIIALTEYLLNKILRIHNVKESDIYFFSTEALEMICNHDWPLNVRQLESFITKVLVDIDFNLQREVKNYENDGTIKINVNDIRKILSKEKTNKNNQLEYNSTELLEKKKNYSGKYDNLYRVELDRVDNLENLLIDIQKNYLSEAIIKYSSQNEIGKKMGYKQSKLSTVLKDLGLNYKAMKLGKKI